MLDWIPFETPTGILIEGKVRGIDFYIKHVNYYAPCSNKEDFWNQIKNSGLFLEGGLIFTRDLILVVFSKEIWGEKSCLDPLVGIFTKLFYDSNLVEASPSPLASTWRNGRLEEEVVAKRLDRFLVNGNLLESCGKYKSWITNFELSNHMPIFLQWDLGINKLKFSFKLNHVWLNDLYFHELVKTCWGNLIFDNSLSPMDKLV